jgi:lipopolysaccharide-induced tumor necrosis factor-alpha factor
MFCSKCGSKIPEGNAFCQWCGPPENITQPTVDTAEAATPPAVQPGTNSSAEQPFPTPPSPIQRFHCPFCEFQGPPIVRKKISNSGMILFAVLLLVCLPLCWLPFVLDGCKEQIRTCAGCGTRLGG